MTNKTGVIAPTSPVSSRFDDLFEKYGTKYGVPPEWLKAICMNESSLGEHPLVQKGLASEDGKSWGIMQLTLPTARDFEQVGIDELNNPEISVRIAAKFVKRIMASFEVVDLRYLEWVVKSYNQGVRRTMQERAGQSPGYAHEYWVRFKRNLKRLGY
ncbi:MAG: transglycosylase SLT domain-containing protein [Oligoflexia bacterium]|nr:transglycosylase SLT domain-containing protein [Oligoflexia bacterium]